MSITNYAGKAEEQTIGRGEEEINERLKQVKGRGGEA